MTNYQADAPDAQDGNEIGFLDILTLVIKHRKLVLGAMLFTLLSAVGVLAILPEYYYSTVKVMPPQQLESAAGSVLGQIEAFAGLMGGNKKSSADTLIAILQSRTLMEKIVQRFNLQQAYGVADLNGAASLLAARSVFAVDKTGVISIEVKDKDANRAADVANAFVEELSNMVQGFALTDASRKRMFFEMQLKQEKDKLTDAEGELDKTPTTSLYYMAAVRNLKYHEATWGVLAKQLEAARLEEAKNIPIVQVLDKAIPAKEPTNPKRKMIIGLSIIGAFFLSALAIYVREAVLRVKAQPERLQAFRSAWR